jgi:hypothetical protein
MVLRVAARSVDVRKPSVIEKTLLAEMPAHRTILLNLNFTVANGEIEERLSRPQQRRILWLNTLGRKIHSVLACATVEKDIEPWIVTAESE